MSGPYRKVPMTKPHCEGHSRCYAPPTTMVLNAENRSLGNYCDAHADKRIALEERFDSELGGNRRVDREGGSSNG